MSESWFPKIAKAPDWPLAICLAPSLRPGLTVIVPTLNDGLEKGFRNFMELQRLSPRWQSASEGSFWGSYHVLHVEPMLRGKPRQRCNWDEILDEEQVPDLGEPIAHAQAVIEHAFSGTLTGTVCEARAVRRAVAKRPHRVCKMEGTRVAYCLGPSSKPLFQLIHTFDEGVELPVRGIGYAKLLLITSRLVEDEANPTTLTQVLALDPPLALAEFRRLPASRLAAWRWGDFAPWLEYNDSTIREAAWSVRSKRGGKNDGSAIVRPAHDNPVRMG